MIPWRTYQSPVTSPDITRPRTYADWNCDETGTPLIGASLGNELVVQSQGLYRNGNLAAYRFPQTVRNTWFNDAFDFDTQLQFEVERFDAQFGQRYETEDTNLPSYDESRLIYGR